MYNSSAIVSAARLLPISNSVAVTERHANKWDKKVEQMTNGSAIMVPCKVSKTGWKYVTQDQLNAINIGKGERFGKFVPPAS